MLRKESKGLLQSLLREPFFAVGYVLRSILSFLTLFTTVTIAISWEWEPTAKHPCTIQRFTSSQFIQRFGRHGLPPLYPKPVIILNDNTYENDIHNNITKKCINEFKKVNNTTSLEFKSWIPPYDVTFLDHCSHSKYKKLYFYYLTEHENLIKLFGSDFQLTLSSSNANSEHRRIVSIEQYFHEVLTLSPETFPTQAANET